MPKHERQGWVRLVLNPQTRVQTTKGGSVAKKLKVKCIKIAILAGTRPEIIKMAPVIKAIRQSKKFRSLVISSGQQKELTQQAWKSTGLVPDIDLAVMRKNQNLAGLTASVIVKLFDVLAREKPEVILVHGDTTTALAGALAGFYAGIKIGHVEAGLRTYDYSRPFPEEMNRRLIDPIATWCFAPTLWAAKNLGREGIPKKHIFVTGNTVVDNLMALVGKSPRRTQLQSRAAQMKTVLITGHRRESFGKGFEQMCLAIRAMADRWPKVRFVYPVHLNPNVQKPVYGILGQHPQISLIEPVGYRRFVSLMRESHFILTDSGGVQEEAPSLGKPVLVMREVTERPEGVLAGTCRLVGTNPKEILRQAAILLENPHEYRRRKRIKNPYGDGRAGLRICKILERSLS